MQHITQCCTGIGLRELHGHPFITVSRPRSPQGPFSWQEGWPRSDVDLQCRIGLAVACLLMLSALEMAALEA